MYEYFPDNYTWCLGTLAAIDGGGDINEIDAALRDLRPLASKGGPEAEAAWYQAWSALAERVEGVADAEAQGDRRLGASRRYLRAANYHLMAERQMTNRSPLKQRAYQRGLAAFAKGLELSGTGASLLAVPYGESHLPAIFVPAPGPTEAPCLICFNGFDSLKEQVYLWGARELPRFGVSTLIVDQPGTGGALRLNGLTARFDTEAPAAACVDFLESRNDVDSDRIGILGISLGGYYAPRAAAFEKRLKCAIAWGAIWDFGTVYRNMVSRRTDSVPSFQASWVFGTEDEAELMRRIEQLTLDGVAENIDCPFLIAHGINDRQIPIELAHKTHDAAINSPLRELKIFDYDEGGVEHCQIDNMTVATDFMFDWAARVLGAESMAAAVSPTTARSSPA